MEENKITEQSTNSMEPEGSSFNIKTIFTLIVLNWQWFLVSMFIFICGALLYLRTTAPVYQVSAKMLIKDEANNRMRSSGQMLSNMQDLGFISNSAGIDNEVEILRSHILAKQAVNDLKLYVEYYAKGRLREQLIYKTQPINVELDSAGMEKISKMRARMIMFKLTRNGDKYDIESEEGDISGSFTTLPATVKTKYGDLTFTQNGARDGQGLDNGRQDHLAYDRGQPLRGCSAGGSYVKDDVNRTAGAQRR